MKTITSILLAVALLSSLSSCSNFIMVQKTYDPEIDLEKNPYRIVFINDFDYTSPVYANEKYGNSYHAGVMKLIEGLSSSFSSNEPFRFLTGDTLKKDIAKGQLTASLTIDTVRAICKRYDSDMLLTLDSLNINFDWETIVNDDGNGKVKNFYLYTRFYLSFYSANGDLVNRSMIENSTLYKSRIALSAIITFKPSLAKAVDAVKLVSYQAGQDYVNKFSPTRVEESRMIYGGKTFKESNHFIKLRYWDKATELLDQLSLSPNRNIALKARHNLSVVKEASALEKE